MNTMLWILLFMMCQCMISMQPRKLLSKDHNDYWKLDAETEGILGNSLWKNKTFYAIAIAGSTRAGKSKIMKSVLENIHNNGGIVHFGNFHDQGGDASVTKGIDVALVEYAGTHFLLFDCEGGNVSGNQQLEKANKYLMVIMSMISQKLIFTESCLTEGMFTGISTILQARKSVCHESQLRCAPLENLCMAFNKYTCNRDWSFQGEPEKDIQELEAEINTYLNMDQNRTLKLLLQTFKKRQSVIVDNTNYRDIFFDDDIQRIVNNIVCDSTKRFPVKDSLMYEDVLLTIGEFGAYIKDVLSAVNGSDNIILVDRARLAYQRRLRDHIKIFEQCRFLPNDYENDKEHEERKCNLKEQLKCFMESTSKYKRFFEKEINQEIKNYGDFCNKLEGHRERKGCEEDVKKRESWEHIDPKPFDEKINILFRGRNNTGTAMAIGGGAGMLFGPVGGILGTGIAAAFAQLEVQPQIRTKTEFFHRYRYVRYHYKNPKKTPRLETKPDIHTETRPLPESWINIE